MTDIDNSVNTGKESDAWKQGSKLKQPFSKHISFFRISTTTGPE